MAGGGPLGAIAALVCETGLVAASYWPQIQVLVVDATQLAASPQGTLALQYAQEGHAAGNQAAANARNTINSSGGGTADPGGPPDKWKFAKASRGRSHLQSHVGNREEAWHDLLELSQEELLVQLKDPTLVAKLQEVYEQFGQNVCSNQNFIGTQIGGQRVYFDVASRVATVLKSSGNTFDTIFRVTSRDEFLRVMAAYGLQPVAGVDLEALLRAAGL